MSELPKHGCLLAVFLTRRSEKSRLKLFAGHGVIKLAVLRNTRDVCQTVWLPEIRKYAGDNVPVLLIGTKEDLLDSSDERQRVTFDTARKAAHEMGCIKFLPCSALTHRGLKQVFDEAFLVAIGVIVKDDYMKPCCIIL
ncbi:Ras family protein [Teladorsagia circumcincta]|uniref:Ras family protein n=1 Tax=Teladorsagia circumcincta TaxID=45464 RepID=A0A2G9V6M0_TELCI|nr:Ras family protein [Teladorsagia circumcincta]